MKLGKAIKLVTIISVLPVGSAFALGSGDFQKFKAATGTITSSLCTGTNGLTCQVINSGAGFLQEQVTETLSGGVVNKYIHTIITEQTAGDAAGTVASLLPYSDESFVRADGTNPGILSKQTVVDTAKNFNSSTSLSTGWAGSVVAGKNINKLVIDQGFTDYGKLKYANGNPVKNDGDSFSNHFTLALDSDAATSAVLGKNMTLDQLVEMGNGGTLANDALVAGTANTTDIQRFTASMLQGTVLPASGSIDLGADTNGVDPAAVAWNNSGATNISGDSVMLVWLGQGVNLSTGTTLDMSNFGFESVSANVQGVATTASTYSRTAAGGGAPFVWDTAFGVTNPITLPALNSIP
ncbi:MAG: hypothetical protein HY940_03630 [Gammaproteobacteria bacterium]|nr:hypothetical protein [Gammaproteobacteria bacterium]